MQKNAMLDNQIGAVYTYLLVHSSVKLLKFSKVLLKSARVTKILSH